MSPAAQRQLVLHRHDHAGGMFTVCTAANRSLVAAMRVQPTLLVSQRTAFKHAVCPVRNVPRAWTQPHHTTCHTGNGRGLHRCRGHLWQCFDMPLPLGLMLAVLPSI